MKKRESMNEIMNLQMRKITFYFIAARTIIIPYIFFYYIKVIRQF